MGQIRIDQAEFDKCSSEIMSALENMEALINEYKAANTNLVSAWVGKSGSSFATVSQNLEETFAMLNKGLHRLAGELQNAGEAFVAMDNALGGAIGGSSLFPPAGSPSPFPSLGSASPFPSPGLG